MAAWIRPLATAAITAALLVPAAPLSAESAPITPQPRIYGGTPATGNPGVAALAINTGSSWSGSCSAAVWKPRILLTAAHCVTADGPTQNVAGLAVFPPGAVAIQYSNTGP
ncbi:MAG: trypsin-like serine protease, partial [Candidatus Nanopelagicales bacterium]|nr:trypsin-like serine protease [Candidatus Nanopelagicales bacterium]